MAAFFSFFFRVISRGLKKGFRTALILISLMVPISFLFVILKWSGYLYIISGLISPLFKYIGLPGSCALAYLTGYLINCYAGIAVMIMLPLTVRELTICSLMILISHNVPVETAIQKKTGSGIAFMMLMRLLISFSAAFIVNLLIPDISVMVNTPLITESVNSDLKLMLSEWVKSSLFMVAKIMVLSAMLLIMHEFLEESGLTARISRLFEPVMKIFGLSKNAAFPWVVANTLGLAYGGGVLINYRKENKINQQEMKSLNISIGISHSLLEDTILFAAIGASVLWITMPRIILACIAVWLYKIYYICCLKKKKPEIET